MGALKARVGDLWGDLLLDLAPELQDASDRYPELSACPVHSDCGGFVLTEDAEFTGGARCWSAGFRDGIDLLSALKRWSFLETCRRIAAWLERVGDGAPLQARPTDPVDELNGKHFIVPVGGKVHVATEACNPDTGHTGIELGSPSDFSLLYANRLVEVGEKRVPISQVWISSPRRREYAGVVFSPGREVPGFYNLWRGFTVEPVQGDCSLFWAHVREVICRCRDEHFTYLRRWMAHMVQCADELPEVAIVVRGSQGTGKTFFVDVLGSLLGQHYVVLNRMEQLTGRFTGHLKDALLVYANEALWGGDKQGEGPLKALITDPLCPVESKGKDIFNVRNRKRLIVTSNESWPVPMGMDDRRFLVLDASDNRKGDSGYFKALHLQMQNGGLQALLYDLMHEELEGFDVRAKPESVYGFDMKLRSAEPVVRWWYERLYEGTLLHAEDELEAVTGWEPPSKDALHRSFLAYCTAHRLRTMDKPSFGKEFRTLFPGYTLGETRLTTGGKRFWCYKLPTLEACQEAFQRYAKVGPEIWS